MAVGGVETEAVVVVVSLCSHLLAEFYGVEVACMAELTTPFHNYLYGFHLSQLIRLLSWLPFQCFHLELSI